MINVGDLYSYSNGRFILEIVEVLEYDNIISYKHLGEKNIKSASGNSNILFQEKDKIENPEIWKLLYSE